jgi:SAM-dependent methyltransferase
MKSAYRRFWVLPRIHRTYGHLSVSETFQRIYHTKAWGDNGELFCSGTGSSGQVAELYCEFVIEFIREHQVQSVVDLGCGDFAIGRRIMEATGIRYTGLDVVPELIEHHKNTVVGVDANFLCVDITKEPLPSADLCLVRQVLQHLSNQEIAKALMNLRAFRWTLISEDVPAHPKLFNRNKPHGPDVRCYYGSGVYIDQPPFSMEVAKLWNSPLTDDTILRTALLEGSIPSKLQPNGIRT